MKKQQKKQQASGQKRKQHDDFFEEEEEEQTFLASDDERGQASDEEPADAEEEETAEEKRLRLGGRRMQQGLRPVPCLHVRHATSCRGAFLFRSSNSIQLAVQRVQLREVRCGRLAWLTALQLPSHDTAAIGVASTKGHPSCAEPPFPNSMSMLPYVACPIDFCCQPTPAAAKEYLQQVRQLERDDGGGGEDEDDEAASDDEEGGGGNRGAGAAAHFDAVSQRLRQEALEGMGHLQRRLAHRVQLPPLPRAVEFAPRGDAAAGGRLLRGHKLAVTAVALTHDDSTVFSVSKDGGIMRTDVESSKR